MKRLSTIDADTLTAIPLPALKFVVDQLLPQGLHILAGAPKVGKSWLALWLCLQVAEGKPVWEFPTTQGTVLYLCLEDSYARIQRRLFQLTEDAPAMLHLANLSERIGCGLEKQINGFLRAHPGTVLVVIDTLQKVCGTTADPNAYANDFVSFTSAQGRKLARSVAPPLPARTAPLGSGRILCALVPIHHLRRWLTMTR